MSTVIPLLCGSADIPNKQNVLFTSLTPLTDKGAAKPKPDFFDGAPLRDLHRELRKDKDLAAVVIPTKHPIVPVAPNFFLEVKGSDGYASVAQRQACYDGAYGSWAMHALQNYGETEPIYDGNASTFSSTYNTSTSTLQLYTHHVSAPTTPDGLPEYHMTKIRGLDITDSRESFVQGATVFRNTMGLTKRHRDGFIQAANARAAQVAAAALEDVSSTSDELHEPVNPAHHIALQDADGELQQQIAEASYYDFHDGEATAISYDDSQEPSQEPVASGDDLSMSFTSSFTSGFSAGPSRSKRSRQSLSPRSKSSGSNVSKSRTRPSAAQRTTKLLK